MNTNKVFYSYNSPALYFDTNVAVESHRINFGISGLVTIRGTLLIKPGGYVVAGRAPSYGPASTLKYDTPGSTYVASEEWYPNTTSGPGVPQNVEITAGTTLSFGAASTPRTALGNVTVDGTLVLSTSIGGDLNVGGNWVNNGAFNANNRTVTFNGTTTVSGSSTTSFAYVTITGALTGHSASMNVARDWTNNGTFNHNNGAVRFNGNNQAIGGTSVSSFFDIFIETFSSVTGPSSGTINVAHNWTNDGAFNHNNGAVHFNGQYHHRRDNRALRSSTSSSRPSAA